MEDVLLLAIVGALLGLDATSVGQFMVSRPLVAGVLAGAVTGGVAVGAGVGAVLELYLLVSFPSGGARFPEGATATVVAVGTASVLAGPAALPLGVTCGLLWGQLAGFSVTAQRKFNGRLVPDPTGVTAAQLSRAHLSAIAVDALRAGVVTGIGLVVARMTVTPLANGWPLDIEESRALLLMGGAVSLGILVNDLGGIRKRGWLVAVGIALGAMGTLL
ncbi:MAG: PTS sugar transporter subunit IIC [Gemmatimonadota bacterium]